jgi:hypothetical protein
VYAVMSQVSLVIVYAITPVTEQDAPVKRNATDLSKINVEEPLSTHFRLPTDRQETATNNREQVHVYTIHGISDCWT